MAGKSPAMKVLLVVHRYLGVAVGLIMTLWCLSGFVMMYRGYPHLEEAARLRGLEPIRLAPGFDASRLPIADNGRLSGFRLEMLADHPVLRLREGSGRLRMVDVATGASLQGADGMAALMVAEAYADGNGVKGGPRRIELIDLDQWTVEGASRRGPVYRIGFDDPAGTRLYVSERTGEAAQVATRMDRFWGWLGAVPHWLYPTLLRRNATLWDGVVVWASLIGCFLTATGLYVGVVRFRRYKSGRWSPYRGWFYWHHILGLVFGVLTLTWVMSGLLTMSPWGFLDSPVGIAERNRLSGQFTGADLKRFLQAAAAQLRPNVVQYEAAPLGGRLFAVARTRNGSELRLDDDARPALLRGADVKAAVSGVRKGPLREFDLLNQPDLYYYSGVDQRARLPAYRATFGDPQSTALYIDASTGQLAQAVDNTSRANRWLRYGLHDWDFPGLRTRPVWDVLVLVLLAGVTSGAITGAWLAIRRIARDATAMVARLAILPSKTKEDM